MQLRTWSLVALFVATAALRLSAQTPTPKLDCNRVMMVQSGLTSTCEMRESVFDGIGSLLIANGPNGGASVYTWDGAQTIVRSRILAAGRSDSQALGVASQVQIAVSPGNVKVTGPSTNRDQYWDVDLEVYVPASSTLRLTTVNGGITVQGLTGAVIASTVNGGIRITDSSGDVTASSVNGGILVSAAAPWKGQTISAKAVNGAVEVAVPADCSAHVELSTVNGSLSSTLPGVTWTVTTRHGTVALVLGSGESRITASTVNGTVKLRPTD